jgi:transcriptional regulator with XRE-family HTH domain
MDYVIVALYYTKSSIESQGPMSNIFAERLRTARELRKMSQAELAQEAKLQPSAISHFETARRSPSFQNLKALSDALNVTTDYLIGRTDDFKNSNAVSLKLLRHAEKMSDEDLETLTSMAEMMARKQKKRE